MMQKLAGPEEFASKYRPVGFLRDYTQGKYIYVGEGCFSVPGFTAKYFWKAVLICI
jgi:hypothetical protein